MPTDYQFDCKAILKKDVFGHIEYGELVIKKDHHHCIRRVHNSGKTRFRWLAKFLAVNEQRSLRKLQALTANSDFALPRLLLVEKHSHFRSYITGQPLYQVGNELPTSYFVQAKKLIKAMRSVGVCNNDLAKEANWLVTPEGKPAVVDFQLSMRSHRRAKWLRICCREDLRHLLKHKRTYAIDTLTAQEKTMLQRKALPTRIYAKTLKPIYLWYTRRILGWQERTGPTERE